MIPYNVYFSLKFNAHINVEVCTSAKPVAYLYKYVFKGSDSAGVSATTARGVNGPVQAGDTSPAVDECTTYHEGRWVGSCEAAWRILGLPLGEIKPPVARLQVHLEDMQRVVIDPDGRTTTAQLTESEAIRQTTLTEYFELNRVAQEAEDDGRPCPYEHKGIVKDPRHYLYQDIPSHFVWVPKGKAWQLRKLGQTVGRMYFMGPKAGEVFYLRLLLANRRSCTSFENLRTVPIQIENAEGVAETVPHVCDNFKDACAALGLTDNDGEWHDALKEATLFGTATMLRGLMVTILTECNPAEPARLWEQHKEAFSSDCRRIIDRQYQRIPRPDPETSEALAYQDQQLALFLLAGLLDRVSRKDDTSVLTTFGLPEADIDFNEYLEERNRLIREELELAPPREDAETAWSKLNSDQLHAAQSIVDAVRVNEFNTGQLFFLDGPGGTGKTFVQNTVMGILRSEGLIVLAVASSGIAATLLEGGQTAHARFKIPLDSTRDSVCKIEKGTFLAGLIKQSKLIFWDESPMQRKYDMMAVSRTISDLCDADESIPFGGKVVCFCGDFRQCTPVCPGAKRGIIVNMNLKATPFWVEVEVLRLTINMRLQDPSLSAEGKAAAAEFADEVLAIGNGVTVENPTADEKGGKAPWRHGFIESNDQLDLIKTIYPNLMTTLPTAQYLGDRAILAIANVDVGMINKICMDRLLGYVHLKYSYDRAKEAEDVESYPSECFHHYDEASLPPDLLHLKVGMPVMILRNIAPPVMCNGTRARILKVNKNVLEAEIIAGNHAGKRVFIPRIPLDSKDDEASKNRRKLVPVPFTRLQFPIRPAFAMTINKSQGQSLRYVGIDIEIRECFSHG